GSPLTHAHYLMCLGNTHEELALDFDRRVHEREFPVCPPALLDGDGRLLFAGPDEKKRFHHGGMFALTRWTNLYFRLTELLWGDAIGGTLADVFGKGIKDVPVWTRAPTSPDFFAHNEYWDIRERSDAPQIAALRAAINLEDADPPPDPAAAVSSGRS